MTIRTYLLLVLLWLIVRLLGPSIDAFVAQPIARWVRRKIERRK